MNWLDIVAKAKRGQVIPWEIMQTDLTFAQFREALPKHFALMHHPYGLLVVQVAESTSPPAPHVHPEPSAPTRP